MIHQRVVCAANRYVQDAALGFAPIIVCGVRHYDKLMCNQLDALPRVLGVETQGFVDNLGGFLTRTEAWIVAKEARQIIYRCGGDEADGGTLYSENLY